MIVETAGATEPSRSAASHRGLIRSIAVLAGSQVVTWTLTSTYTVIVPRMLGPTAMGELATANSAVNILTTFVELGLTVLLVRKIAQNRSRAGELIVTTLLIQAALYVPAVGLMAAFIRGQHFSPEQQIIVWLATAGLLPAILKLPFQSAYQATNNMALYSATGVITRFLYCVVGIGLVFLGLGVVSLAMLGASIEAFTLVLNIAWARPRFHMVWNMSIRRAAALAFESLPFFANYVIHSTYLWINVLLLATLTSATVVGWYGVSSRLVGTFYFLPVIVSTALLPRFSASFDGRLDALQARARPAVQMVMVLSLPIALGGALVSAPIVDLIYGPQFGPSAMVLSILLASVPFTYFNILIWQVLVASSRQIIWTKVMAVALVVNVTLNIVLITLFQSRIGNGAIGSALAFVGTEGLMSLIGLIILPGLFDRASAARLLRSAVATLLMGVGVWLLRPIGLGAEIGGGVIAFGAVVLPLRVFTVIEIRALYTGIRLRRVASATA